MRGEQEDAAAGAPRPQQVLLARDPDARADLLLREAGDLQEFDERCAEGLRRVPRDPSDLRGTLLRKGRGEVVEEDPPSRPRDPQAGANEAPGERGRRVSGQPFEGPEAESKEGQLGAVARVRAPAASNNAAMRRSNAVKSSLMISPLLRKW